MAGDAVDCSGAVIGTQVFGPWRVDVALAVSTPVLINDYLTLNGVICHPTGQNMSFCPPAGAKVAAAPNPLPIGYSLGTISAGSAATFTAYNTLGVGSVNGEITLTEI